MTKACRQIRWSARLGAALLLVGLATACAAPAEPDAEPEPGSTVEPGDRPTDSADRDSGEIRSGKQRVAAEASPDELVELAAGNSAFALDLYQELRTSGENLFYSPYSISLALAMTYAGARGETERQMAETMHYDLEQELLHPTFNALDADLTSRGGEDFQLNIANAIWGQVGYEFLPAFLDTLAENYGAGLRTLDFADEPHARETINKWVSEQTEEKIKNLIPPNLLSSAVRLVLANAIYFNGQWILPFQENATHGDIFHLLDGSNVMASMMTQIETFRYAAGEGYQAVALPYLGADTSMIIILPETGRFEEVERGFTADFLAEVVDELERQQVALTMPKFSFESEIDLTQTLSGMGMASAFGAGADFSGMTGSPDLFIGHVLHKAFVDVDEAGTEAAAATAVVMLESAMEVEDPVEMKVDRPFLFLIRDDRTGTILFAGRLLNPA